MAPPKVIIVLSPSYLALGLDLCLDWVSSTKWTIEKSEEFYI